MAKLTKAQRAAHAKALAILEQDILSTEDKEFVFNNFHEGATSMNGDAGAFFTPLGMAESFAHDVIGDDGGLCNRRVIDLCAGIGVLAFALVERYRGTDIKLVCVDSNYEYVEIGKKLVPEAEWHCADVMDKDFILSLGHFDDAVSNPPFGRVRTMKDKHGDNYTGGEAEFKVMDIAAMIADDIAFIVPQQSAGFKYSGAQYHQWIESSKYKKFNEQTGIELQAGMGYDTTQQDMGNFKDVSITVEFAHANVTHIEPKGLEAEPEQISMFG